MWRRSLLTALICLTTLGSLVSCSQNRQDTKEEVKIVATFLPVYLFTRGVTGDIPVEILITPNKEVHDYQATPGNARTVAEANILVKNGLGIEEFLEKLIGGNSQLTQIDASEGIEPIVEEEDEEKGEHAHHHEEEDEEQGEHAHHHHHEEGDPHVWLDPVLAQKQVTNIRDGLIAANPANEETYRTNGDAYIAQLQELDREFAAKLAPVKGCKFMVFHDAFAYLAQRYGLEQIAILGTPEDNMTPADIQKVLNLANSNQVKVFLAEPGVEDKRLEQIAKESGLPVETLDPLESGETDPQYYFRVMKQNLASLEKACK